MNPDAGAPGAARIRTDTSGWYVALALASVGVIPLCWLLARLIWLPLYMGLFFFIIAGLLVGAATFRLASKSRPIGRWRIVRGSGLVAIVGGAAFLTFEYMHFVRTVGEAPHFPDAKNAAMLKGQSARGVEALATSEFQRQLGIAHPPGGALGYARWSIADQAIPLIVDSTKENITSPHAGFRWLTRSIAAFVLLGLGVYLSYDALRFADRVSNILAEGEPYEEEF